MVTRLPLFRDNQKLLLIELQVGSPCSRKWLHPFEKSVLTLLVAEIGTITDASLEIRAISGALVIVDGNYCVECVRASQLTS